MDRTGWIVVVVCFVLLLAYPSVMHKMYPPVPKPAIEQTAPSTEAPKTAAAPALSPATPSLPPVGPALTPSLSREAGLGTEEVVTLENDWVRVEFSSHGAGVKRVFLKKHFAEGTDPVVLNRASTQAIFNLRGWFKDDLVGYQVQSSTSGEVVFSRDLKTGVKLLRQYTLGQEYELALKQTLDGSKLGESLTLPEYRLHLGLSSAVHLLPADRMYVKVAWYDLKGAYHSDLLTSFDGFSLLGIQFSSPKEIISSPASDPLRWAAVKDQFFAVILTSDSQPILRVDARREYLPELKRELESIPDGISASLVMGGVTLEPGKVLEQQFHLYTGPKEDSILARLEHQKDKVMEFGWMAWVSKPLLWTMNYIYGFVGNYGWSIVILTILLKALLWYPQSMANLSMKRMQVVAPLMKQPM